MLKLVFWFNVKYARQYNVIQFADVGLRDILRSWMIAPNNLIVSINRTYDRREAYTSLTVTGQNHSTALMYLPFLLESFLKNPVQAQVLSPFFRRYYYPFYWAHENQKANTENCRWMNQTTSELFYLFKVFQGEHECQLVTFHSKAHLRHLPDGDRWIAGNHRKTFAAFRVNYDFKNWGLLVEKLWKNARVSLKT